MLICRAAAFCFRRFGEIMSLNQTRKTTLLFAISVAALAMGLYYIFDTFLLTTGEEIAKAWYYGEIVNLQEGQILPAISKNQNLLQKSPFVRSVVLTDLKDPERYLFSIGEKIQPISKASLDKANKFSGEITNSRSGFLSYQLIAKLPGPNSLFIVYDVSSKLLIWSYLFTVAISIVFVTYLINFTIQFTNSERKKREDLRRDLLKRLAHDVNSPLLAISSLSLKLKKKDFELHRKLEQATDSIRNLFDQTDKLDQKLIENKDNSKSAIDEETEPVPVVPIIKEFINQKRGEYSNHPELKIDLSFAEESKDAFVNINLNDFKRHLSNLLKNAVEAVEKSNQQNIELRICASSEKVEISISDSGCGIPKDVLPKLGQKGVSLGKKNGQGLGLHFAYASVQHWKGKVQIESELEQGTTILISLPRSETPAWFTSKINLPQDQKIVVLDDDASVLAQWKSLFRLHDKEFVSFQRAQEFKTWFNTGGQFEDKLFFIFDYHLDSNNTGLELMDSLGISSEAILVTSAYLDEEVIEKAQSLQVQIMPKVMIS